MSTRYWLGCDRGRVTVTDLATDDSREVVDTDEQDACRRLISQPALLAALLAMLDADLYADTEAGKAAVAQARAAVALATGR